MPPYDRRSIMATGLGLLTATAASAGSRQRPETVRGTAMPATETGLELGSESDQTRTLQSAIDRAASSGTAIELPPGRFHVSGLQLRPGSRLVGAHGATKLVCNSGLSCITGTGTDEVMLCGFIVEGGGRPIPSADLTGLISLAHCRNVALTGVTVEMSGLDGIALTDCSGRISDCDIRRAARTGIRSIDAAGLDIANNSLAHCGDNGVQVWRTSVGEDGTRIANNRIEHIRAASGGTGENGNGISIFRASHVLVTGNRITDCAYTAIRGNAANDLQIVANSCARLGEVALYAEFGFEGALIASNLIDTAATGISVTNFNEGGRLAVIQGNLIRNLFRREHEPQDKRGDGIGVEADASVTGNTIEGAPTAGIAIGFGRYMRDVVATGNLIRNCRAGITISSDAAAGSCFVSGNMISGAREGAIRASDHHRLHGPDLSKEVVSGRVTIQGNMVA